MSTLIVLVTGITAAGNSCRAAAFLPDHVAVSLDGYEGLCTWTDLEGAEVARPPHPDRPFLEAHEWMFV